MRPVKILSVCGSGKVSSAMLASKLTTVLEEKGYDVETTEVDPGGVTRAIAASSFDLNAYTSPREDIYQIPLLNATGFLVGINEDEFLEKLFEVLETLTL